MGWADRKKLFSQAEINEAVQFVEEYASPKRVVDARNNAIYLPSHTVVIVGYSAGGDAAYRTAEILRERGITVNLVFTVDPVPFHRLPFLNMGVSRTGADWVGQPAQLTNNKLSNVLDVVNFYQHVDTGTLLSVIGSIGWAPVRGSSVNVKIAPNGTVVNTEVTKQMIDAQFGKNSYRAAHTFMPYLAQVRASLEAELAKLPPRPPLVIPLDPTRPIGPLPGQAGIGLNNRFMLPPVQRGPLSDFMRCPNP